MFLFRLLFPLCRTRAVLLTLFCTVQAFSAFAQSPRKHSSAKATPSPASASPSPAATYTVPDPVAVVDTEQIHRDDLERVANVLLANRGKSIQGLGADDQKKVLHSVLDDMITDRLVNRQAASEMVAPLDVEKRFSELKAQYPTQDGFDAEIKKSGQTPDQVRENLRIQLAQQQWIEHRIADQINVTPEEVEKFYKEGPPSKFDSPEMVRASHILISVRRDAPPEEALAAEQKLDTLAARLKKGESFESLAREDSADPNAKQPDQPDHPCGDLGYFSRDRIMPEFADAAFKLKVGEVSAPVRTQFGFHLIKLTGRQPARTATLDQARDQITAYIREEKRRAAVAGLVQSLRENAKIEILLP